MCLAFPVQYLWTFVSTCAIIGRGKALMDYAMRQMTMGRFAAGKFLEVVREERGMTPSEAGRKIGWSGKQVRRWETGESEPPYAGVRKLLKLLGCPPLLFDGLLLDDSKTAADGIQVAGTFLAEEARKKQPDPLTPEQRTTMEQLLADPKVAAVVAAKINESRVNNN